LSGVDLVQCGELRRVDFSLRDRSRELTDVHSIVPVYPWCEVDDVVVLHVELAVVEAQGVAYCLGDDALAVQQRAG
jgi:hypothetical protein